MKPIRCIVAGVGELLDDDPTLLLALDLAHRTGARLHLVHAYELPQLFTMSPGVEMMVPEGTEQYRAQMQGLLESVVRRNPLGERAECHAVAGSPGRVLPECAEQFRAELVIVGAARRGRLGMLGTTAQRVLRAAHMPVLVARESLHRRPARVLLTTDLSDLSASVQERGLDVLEALYGPEPTQLRSLLVLTLGIMPPPLPAGSLERAATAELERFLLRRRARANPVQPVVRVGSASTEIVDEARDENADLLVVGTHARHGVSRVLLGSVAEACIRDAPCSVLAVPPVRVPAPVRAPRESALAAVAMA
ncbi:MAG TPA: universal stress protein [Longimicrobium sp.]|nr:universal stress protein [Longimicrobium sp.]